MDCAKSNIIPRKMIVSLFLRVDSIPAKRTETAKPKNREKSNRMNPNIISIIQKHLYSSTVYSYILLYLNILLNIIPTNLGTITYTSLRLQKKPSSI